MKHIFSILWVASLCSNSIAQYSFIPNNPTYVMSFNLGTLGKKIDLNKMSNYKLLKSKDSNEYVNFQELNRRMIGNLNESGADIKQKLIAIGTNDSMRATMYLIPLVSAKKAIQVIEKFNKEIKWEDQRLRPSKSGKVNYFMSPKNALYVAIFSDLCVIMNGNYSYYYNDDEYEYDRALDSVRLVIDSIRQIKNTHEPTGTAEPQIPEIDTNRIDYDSTAYVPDYVEEPSYQEYHYDDDSLMKAFRAWWEKQRVIKENIFWSKKENGVKKYLEDMHNLPKTKKGIIYENKEFATESAVQKDVFHWMDYTYGFKMVVKEAGSYSYTDSMGEYQRHRDSSIYNETALGKFLGELVLMGHGDFNNGSTDMNYNLKMSDSVQKYLNQITGASVNIKLFDYIKTPQVASITSQNLKHSALIDLYFAGVEQYRITAEKSRGNMQIRNNFNQIGFTVTELMYTLMDKDMLYHTFSGNAISAVTGIVKSRTSYQSWEYDEEGNYIATTKFKEDEYPKFVSIFETENQQNLDKLLLPFIKNRFLTRRNNIYYIKDIGTNYLYPIFMVKTANALIVTNDSLYTNPDYLKMPPGLDPNYVETIAAMPVYFELNGIGSSNLLREISLISPIFKDKGVVALNSINKATITCQKSMNHFNINFDFKNKNRCSLIDMMEMLDLMYD